MTSPAEQKLDVEVEVKQLDGGQVELAVTVAPAPVAAAREQAIKAFGRHTTIPGFRKGKAPRAILERQIDSDALKRHIIDEMLEGAYDAALEKAGITPLDRARISDADLTDEGALTFSATVTLRPEIDLGEYKGLNVTRRITRVTDDHVQTEVDRMRSRRAHFRDLPEGAAIEKGDLVVVDYDMLVEGEKREDASTSGYPLEVGSDELFPELNEALLGARPADTREVEVAYPSDHSDSSLAGRSVQFQVTIRDARRRQLPDLDDEFAKQVSDLDTVEALRSRIRENLEAVGKAIADQEVREALVRQASDVAVLDVPQAVVNREVDRRIDDTEEELERRSLTLHEHLRNTGRSFDDWRADIEVEARQAARRALVLDEIGERENIRVAEDEIKEEIDRRAEAEGVGEAALRERLSEPGEFNRLVTRIYQRKVVQFLLDNAEVSEEIVEPEAEEEEAAPADADANAGGKAEAGEGEAAPE